METSRTERDIANRMVRYEFAASSRLKQVTRSFMNEKLHGITPTFYSAKSALLTTRELHHLTQNGSLRRIEQMAQNLESPLYPDGSIIQHLSARALQLSFGFSGGSLERLKALGDRLEDLDNPELGPSLAHDVIFVRMPRAVMAEEEERNVAAAQFEAVMKDEFQKHYYHVEPKRVVYSEV